MRGNPSLAAEPEEDVPGPGKEAVPLVHEPELLHHPLRLFGIAVAQAVKRLRRDPHARVAACDMRGNVRGDWREGTGRVLEDPADVDAGVAEALATAGPVVIDAVVNPM